MKALFIGRFQPFHKGHADVVRKALEECSGIIIGIGSSEKESTAKNPYSFKKRKEMIEKALEEERIPRCRYQIKAIPDIPDDSEWVRHVERICGNADIVYSGNPHTLKLFRAKGYILRKMKREIRVSATEIRKRLRSSHPVEGMLARSVEGRLASKQ